MAKRWTVKNVKKVEKTDARAIESILEGEIYLNGKSVGYMEIYEDGMWGGSYPLKEDGYKNGLTPDEEKEIIHYMKQHLD